MDEGILKDKFNRLFYLSDNKLTTEADMFLLGCGDGGEAWKCCRRLLAWEEELGRECCELLLPIVLHADMNERWI